MDLLKLFEPHQLKRRRTLTLDELYDASRFYDNQTDNRFLCRCLQVTRRVRDS